MRTLLNFKGRLTPVQDFVICVNLIGLSVVLATFIIAKFFG